MHATCSSGGTHSDETMEPKLLAANLNHSNITTFVLIYLFLVTGTLLRSRAEIFRGLNTQSLLQSCMVYERIAFQFGKVEFR